MEPLSVRGAGQISAELEWSGGGTLELSLAGPDDDDGARASVRGPSPLAVRARVSEDDLARGADWWALVRSPGGAAAAGMLRVQYPDASDPGRWTRPPLQLKSGETSSLSRPARMAP